MQTSVAAEQELSPFSWYHAMRKSPGVRYNAADDYWEVFRYSDVLRIATDHATFSSEQRWRLVAPEDERMAPPSIISMDPPRHRKLRGLVTQAFTPRVVAQLAPRITDIVNELLEKVVSRGKMDVIDDLAYPLPVTVIAELLGVPVADRPQFKRWSDAIIAADDETADNAQYSISDRGEGRRQAARSALREMDAYFTAILAEHRQRPQRDLISDLLAAEVDGQRLTNDELLGFCTLLLVAGNITTTNLLGNAMVCFDEHPDALATLRREPGLISTAIEEVLRYRPPAKILVRIVATDTSIGGQPLHTGQLVMAWIGSANHDETRFHDPERFDVRREPNPHLGFGHGIHFCIGAPLARLEGKIALQLMLERLPGLQRAPGVRLKPINSPILSGVKHYPIVFCNA